MQRTHVGNRIFRLLLDSQDSRRLSMLVALEQGTLIHLGVMPGQPFDWSPKCSNQVIAVSGTSVVIVTTINWSVLLQIIEELFAVLAPFLGL